MPLLPWKLPASQKLSASQRSSIIEDAIVDWERTTRQCAALIKATDAAEIAKIEVNTGLTQQHAVTHFIEGTDWGIETFPQYQDRQGSFEERLDALRLHWKDWDPAA